MRAPLCVRARARVRAGVLARRLSTEIVRVSRTEDSRLKVILSLPCGNLEEILKNYPRLYNQLNPCSRALQSVKTLRTRRTRTCGPGAPNPGRGPGAGAGAGAFKLLPNASNRMPLDIEILPKGLNVHSTLLFASYSAVIILMHLILSKLDALIRLNWMH